jgi:epoxide hydrolase
VSDSTAITPFTIDIAEAQLEDLQYRLERTRWPEAETVEDQSQGVPLSYVRALCEYWREQYDWREREVRLNRYSQFRTEIEGLGIHFVHVRSPERDALPLLMTHGWPGSIVEFQEVIGPLSDPAAHGGDPGDAFHVICPSLPGYGFSDKPTREGWDVSRIAGAWCTLMRRLGYDHYVCQGGDWGSMVTINVAAQAPDSVDAIHLNMPIVAPDLSDAPTQAEQAILDDLAEFERWGNGYQRIQSTRPQTLGYGLVDSPSGQAAWIVEKFWQWSDNDGDLEAVIPLDRILDNIMLYWLPGTGASSARLYWESSRRRSLPNIEVPVGCSIFPKEIVRTSRRWAESQFPTLNFWSEPERGGHFAAFEQPDRFIRDVRECFRLTRGSRSRTD